MKPDPTKGKATAGGHVVRGTLLVLLLLATGCAGNPVPPGATASATAPARNLHGPADVSAADTALLTALEDMPGSARSRLDGHILEAGAPYHAASGHVCRYVRLLDASGNPVSAYRLACREGGRRFFAVDVFAGTPGTLR